MAAAVQPVEQRALDGAVQQVRSRDFRFPGLHVTDAALDVRDDRSSGLAAAWAYVSNSRQHVKGAVG